MRRPAHEHKWSSAMLYCTVLYAIVMMCNSHSYHSCSIHRRYHSRTCESWVQCSPVQSSIDSIRSNHEFALTEEDCLLSCLVPSPSCLPPVHPLPRAEPCCSAAFAAADLYCTVLYLYCTVLHYCTLEYATNTAVRLLALCCACARRLSHFEHVKVSDLERVGMSKPAARRLLDAVKRERKSAAGRRVRFSSFCT